MGVLRKAIDPTRSHKLDVRPLGTQNASSNWSQVDVDAFVVIA